MTSIRALSLIAGAAALIAVPAFLSRAQQTDSRPAPATQAATQPIVDPNPEGGQPQPGLGGEGRRAPYGQPGAGRGGDANGLPQSVKQSMSIMNRALRILKNQASDATKQAENLKLVGDMQRGCLAAKALLPERQLSRAPDDAKKNELTMTYRKQLILMMEKLLKLETAILDGKGDAANKLIGEIGVLRDESHEKLGARD